MTRKDFLKTTAGAAALTAVASSGAMTACSSGASGKIKRGVSIYSYSGVLGVSMSLEDCFADMYDMGATGLEMLAAHVEGYPNPTDEWIKWYWEKMKQYEITPVEFGHWVDSKLFPGRFMTTEESYERLVRDLKIANQLGFTRTRTMLGITDIYRTPVDNWREFVEKALPVAEELNIKMGVEIHIPSKVDDKYLFDHYVDFIEKTKTKNWGFVLDFGVFSNRPSSNPNTDPFRPSAPKDMIPILPYIYCCHAKFNNMTDDYNEQYIPYAEIIDVMNQNNWEGYLLSEYEGQNKSEPGYASNQLRKQHIMLSRLLGA
jgi:hypothetical protein